MSTPAMTMPVPYTPLYIGLAQFVANQLGAIAESDPDDISRRADQLSQKGNDLRALVQECQQALGVAYGSDAWSGSAADSSRGLITALLQQLSQRADKAEEEAQTLRAIAKLLKTAQDYYTKQATLAEKIVSSLLQSPFSRPLAQMMAVAMGMQLARMMNRFEQALSALGANQLTPLWNDADQVAAQSFGYSYPSM
jgi:uncharacterized protein YukE